MKVGLIGAGNLGKSIIDCLMDKDVELAVSSEIEEKYGEVEIIYDNRRAIKDSEIVILAVKPQSMATLLEEIGEMLYDKLVISFAAGLKIDFFEARQRGRIVRVMSNLGIRYGEGMNVFMLGKSCTQSDRSMASKLLGYMGETLEVDDESLIDTVTGISGSGIAYFMRIINIFINSGMRYGLAEKEARHIVVQTMIGAGALVKDSEDIDQLISRVASKGGTTEQGLKEMEERGLDKVLESVIDKTISKCKNLGEKR